MSPGFRHIEHGVLSRYANSIYVNTFPSGERRIGKAPTRELLIAALTELGTQAAVASAFGVSRGTVKHWAQSYGLAMSSHPEAGLASMLRRRLGNELYICQVSQWLMDEGSVSVAYFARGDYTILLVCGSMNDYEVLRSIARMIDTTITSSKAPGPTTLPMGALRVQSARAYALLQVIMPHLVGLKAKEAEAALKFFPPSGIMRGRHTTDEFLLGIWKDFATNALHEWNSRRRVKVGVDELEKWAGTWVEGRIRRARRFVDANEERRNL